MTGNSLVSPPSPSDTPQSAIEHIRAIATDERFSAEYLGNVVRSWLPLLGSGPIPVSSKDESLQQRAMSFLSTLVNTQRWNYAQAYDLVREMLDAKWNVPEAKPSRKYLNLGREYVRDHLKTIEGGTAVCLFAIWLDSRTQAAETAKVEPSKDRVPDHELREYIEELEPGHTFHRLLTELALLRALTDMPVAATETGLTACAMCADGVGREYGYHMVNGEQIECPAVKRAHETKAERFDLAAANTFGDAIVQRVCEIPDRTSPDDQPEMLLCLPSELHNCIVAELEHQYEKRTGRSVLDQSPEKSGAEPPIVFPADMKMAEAHGDPRIGDDPFGDLPVETT